ncbi:MAG: FliG C-terminal domain-containing protein [Spirochaetales bacterium]|uniref:FliG C-terminal domain-containing protein n=1 Tax=Candidatus Thalassospirochaeta sargassi TaxID=3119039 RepID=A0AAJ1IDZ7_9SPIO|nr:FliG C-terminal domain-containing protein [Spirochaetales bacterium]
MNYDFTFGSKIQCSENEKKHSLILLKEILEQTKKARTAGFLVLGQDSDSITNAFLKDSVKLIGKGYDYQAVEKILEIKMAVRNAEGIHLLEMAMVKEGILSILRGDPVSLTEEILFSFLGTAIYEAHKKEQNDEFTRHIIQLSQGERTARSECGFWLLNASDNEISFLLKAFDWESLGVLMKVETDAVLYRIYSNLSKEAGKLFRERLQMQKAPDAKTINSAENKFRTITAKISGSKETAAV